MSKLRTITANMLHRMEDLPGHDGWDEAYVDGSEVWDVGINREDDGKIVICTAARHPLIVDPTHPEKVR